MRKLIFALKELYYRFMCAVLYAKSCNMELRDCILNELGAIDHDFEMGYICWEEYYKQQLNAIKRN